MLTAMVEKTVDKREGTQRQVASNLRRDKVRKKEARSAAGERRYEATRIDKGALACWTAPHIGATVRRNTRTTP
jgi:hypothetical protein